MKSLVGLRRPIVVVSVMMVMPLGAIGCGGVSSSGTGAPDAGREGGGQNPDAAMPLDATGDIPSTIDDAGLDSTLPEADLPDAAPEAGDEANTGGDSAGCGDGVREGAEQCDDGNLANLDGCDAQCRFEQETRATSLKVQFGKDSFCTANAFGGAFTAIAQTPVQQIIDGSVTDGSLSFLLKYMNVADLAGASGSVTVGGLSGAPVPYVSPATGNSDLDWWYTVDPTTIDADRNPNATALPGMFAAGTLTAGPGHVWLSLLSGKLDVADTMLKLRVGAASAPGISSGQAAPGHVAAEQLDPALQSFATAGGTPNGETGQVCGNVTAASLALSGVPTTLLAGGMYPCSQNYTVNNSLLDVFVGGCTYIVPIITATQPDKAASDAAPQGAGAPYKLSADPTSHVVNGCKDSAGAGATLADCLRAAAYSAYVKVAMDRVIIH